MTRVLLFCPTVKLGRDTTMAIHGIRFSGALDILFARDNPHGEYNVQNIVQNYQKAERIIKAEGYDYLLTIEDDILPPPDALEKLIAVDADIAYGVYCFRRGMPMINIQRDDTGESYSLPRNLKAWAELFGQIIPCGGLGFGCTLIKRSALDAAPLHSSNGGDADTQLALDARRLGLRQRADTSVLCGHRRTDGTVIWPARDGYNIAGNPAPLPTRPIRALRPLAFWTQDEIAVVMKAGDMKDIDLESAAAFVATGRAEYAT
jgi:hypothetical protein